MKRSAFEVRHPFFRPAWRRAAVVALCFGWTAVEAMSGNVFWALLFGACGAYTGYMFFLAFDPADYEKRDDSK